MSNLQRFNEKTGRKEFYIEVKGIPGGYWTALGLCDKCYGLAKLSNEEWLEFENSPTKLLADLEVTSCCE
jgi:hypothetical protein